MKRFSVKLLSVLMALLSILSASIGSAGAVTFSNDVQTKSEAILLVSMDNGQTVFEKNADKKMYPASTTKIMTYIVAYENIEDIENTRVLIKKEVIDTLLGTGSSMAFLSDHIGQKVSVIDLLYSMMVPSGNDAALVLADYVGGGNIAAFVEMMNAKAQEIGCENTHFSNPDGLHDNDHYTTARDILKITNYALRLPNFKKISDTVSYTCEGDDTPLKTTNLLIDGNSEYYYTYAEGIKTGTTDQAGRCLVTTASADGQSYILVLLGAPYREGVQEEYYNFLDAAALFRWCLTALELTTVKTTETPICETKVKYAMGRDKVTLVPEKDLVTILPKNRTGDSIVMETEVPGELEAPLTTEQVVGTASVYYVDTATGERQLIETVNLLPSEPVDRSAFAATLEVAGEIFRSYWFIIIIALILIIVLIYIIAAKVHRSRKRKNRDVKRYRNL
ncbi:MAG: D-alanyl-D-alanine carboxypeptidase [Ruminococcus sp.]|nr:D-alanyl-D-alanine carboxypeptidase [Ruminococcus sp.]